MSAHLRREIEKLKRQLLSLAATVEDCLWNAIRSIIDRDPDLARNIIENDDAVDFAEVQVEEEALKILALHQPVAIDLRLIVAVLKINSDLERIGDLAVHIAEQGAYFASRPPVDMPFDLTEQATRVRNMLRGSLDALVNLNVDAARKVCLADDEVDMAHHAMFTQITQCIRRHPEQLDVFLRFRSISGYLERIADHATNIAEDVIYMIEGEIVRHHPEEA